MLSCVCALPGPPSSSWVRFFLSSCLGVLTCKSGVVIRRLLAQRTNFRWELRSGARPLFNFFKSLCTPRDALGRSGEAGWEAIKFCAPVWTVLAATFTLDESLSHILLSVGLLTSLIQFHHLFCVYTRIDLYIHSLLLVLKYTE